MDETSKALKSALHAHIQGIAARELTPRMLLELEKTCSYIKNLLALGKDPNAINRIPGTDGWASSYMGASPADYGMTPAVSPPQETFGAQAIRQLLEVLPALLPKKEEEAAAQMSYLDITQAIQLAHSKGDSLLESDLRKILSKETGVVTSIQEMLGEPDSDRRG